MEDVLPRFTSRLVAANVLLILLTIVMFTLHSHNCVAFVALTCAIASVIDIAFNGRSLRTSGFDGWLPVILLVLFAAVLHITGWSLWLYTYINQVQFSDVRDILGLIAPFAAILFNVLAAVMVMTLLRPNEMYAAEVRELEKARSAKRIRVAARSADRQNSNTSRPGPKVG